MEAAKAWINARLADKKKKKKKRKRFGPFTRRSGAFEPNTPISLAKPRSTSPPPPKSESELSPDDADTEAVPVGDQENEGC